MNRLADEERRRLLKAVEKIHAHKIAQSIDEKVGAKAIDEVGVQGCRSDRGDAEGRD